MINRYKYAYNNGNMIHHYTSENGVRGIIRENSIVFHLTRAEFLNDITEGEDVYLYLENVCNNMLKNGEIDQKQYNYLIDAKKINQKLFINNASLSKSKIDGYNTYIMSFSINDDSLPMWNYYANCGNLGYSLAFNCGAIRNAVHICLEDDVECRLEDVVYSKERKEITIKEAIEDFLKNKKMIENNPTMREYIGDYNIKNELGSHLNDVRS